VKHPSPALRHFYSHGLSAECSTWNNPGSFLPPKRATSRCFTWNVGKSSNGWCSRAPEVFHVKHSLRRALRAYRCYATTERFAWSLDEQDAYVPRETLTSLRPGVHWPHAYSRPAIPAPGEQDSSIAGETTWETTFDVPRETSSQGKFEERLDGRAFRGQNRYCEVSARVA
jgi:hypothetical protein